MFTGIIEETGCITMLRRQSGILRIAVRAEKIISDARIGDSICVSGVCLTIVDIKGRELFFDVVSETASVSTLRNIVTGQKVNLERALKVGDRLGGHFVTGHVDCMGTIRHKRLKRGNLEFGIALPAKYLKFIVNKGSVAVDGISLTIASVRGGSFFVSIIPHTAKVTTLGFKHAGDKVNLELDMLAKL